MGIMVFLIMGNAGYIPSTVVLPRNKLEKSQAQLSTKDPRVQCSTRFGIAVLS